MTAKLRNQATATDSTQITHNYIFIHLTTKCCILPPG